MYNKDIKIRFIQQQATNASLTNAYVRLFNLIEEYENAKEKDICLFTTEEISEIPSLNMWANSATKKTMLGYLNAYLKWCKANNLCEIKPGVIISDDLNIEKVRSCMIANPLHLQTELNKIFDSESTCTIDCSYRCYYWLGFGGMKEDDAFKVTSSDVDLQNMIVKYSEGDIQIYSHAIPAFRAASELKYYNMYNAHYKDGFTQVQRVEGDQIMRGIHGAVTKLNIRTALRKFINKAKEENDLKNDLTFKRVRLSGYFYRMYELEQIGIVPNFLGYVHSTSKSETNSAISDMCRSLEKDYEAWKLAFKI